MISAIREKLSPAEGLNPWRVFFKGLFLMVCVGSALIAYDQIETRNKELEAERTRASKFQGEATSLQKENSELKKVVTGWNEVMLDIVTQEQTIRQKLHNPTPAGGILDLK